MYIYGHPMVGALISTCTGPHWSLHYIHRLVIYNIHNITDSTVHFNILQWQSSATKSLQEIVDCMMIIKVYNMQILHCTG